MRQLGDGPLIKQTNTIDPLQAQDEEEDALESSQWTLLDSDNEDCEEQFDSSQASMVGALSILISPIKMITSLVNPEESQDSLPPDEDDAFNEAVILNSQLEDDAC